jgi:NADPH:quinone reductase-like Zn-dependent oxidoreductase
MTLWKWLQVPMYDSAQVTRDSDRELLLVWGGSSITGQFLIQVAAYSGFEVITVASEKTKDLLQGMGAKHIITRDGKSNEAIVAEIRSIGGNNIYKGVDIVGPETALYCMKALSTEKPVRFAPLSFLPKDTVAPANVEVQNVEMKWFILDKSSEKYAVALNNLLERGVVKMPQLEILGGGVSTIEEGLNMQKRGDRGGRKLIVSFQA